MNYFKRITDRLKEYLANEGWEYDIKIKYFFTHKGKVCVGFQYPGQGIFGIEKKFPIEDIEMKDSDWLKKLESRYF